MSRPELAQAKAAFEKVRAILRVQATKSSNRANGQGYQNSGTGTSALAALPDYTVAFDVSPRNMNLGR